MLRSPGEIGRIAAASGAFVGTYSHVVLDSVMHADMTPFSPWSAANGLQGTVSIATLQYMCVAAGLLGVLAWLALAHIRRRAAR